MCFVPNQIIAGTASCTRVRLQNSFFTRSASLRWAVVRLTWFMPAYLRFVNQPSKPAGPQNAIHLMAAFIPPEKKSFHFVIHPLRRWCLTMNFFASHGTGYHLHRPLPVIPPGSNSNFVYSGLTGFLCPLILRRETASDWYAVKIWRR